jgi:RNA polymerase sigma-70 factor (ECF subfamily)
MNASEFTSNFQERTLMLQSYAYSLTRDMEDAQDLFQETAYRAFKNIDKFREDTNLNAWLMTIMKNIFINNYRRKTRQKTTLDGSDNQFLLNSGDRTVSNDGGSNIMMEELETMVSELEDPLRVPFLMHHEGFKYQEIADKFDLPLGTVKSRIFFARKELQSKMMARFQVKDLASLN